MAESELERLRGMPDAVGKKRRLGRKAGPHTQAIKEIMLEHPTSNADQIATELDRRAAKNSDLEPPEFLRNRAGGERLWAHLIKNKKVSHDVRGYINPRRKYATKIASGSPT